MKKQSNNNNNNNNSSSTQMSSLLFSSSSIEFCGRFVNRLWTAQEERNSRTFLKLLLRDYFINYVRWICYNWSNRADVQQLTWSKWKFRLLKRENSAKEKNFHLSKLRRAAASPPFSLTSGWLTPSLCLLHGLVKKCGLLIFKFNFVARIPSFERNAIRLPNRIYRRS